MAAQTTTTRTARRSSPRTPKSTGSSRRTRSGATLIDPDRRRGMIAEAAYYRAERRGFQGGSEDADWLAAEAEVDTLLTLGVRTDSN